MIINKKKIDKIITFGGEHAVQLSDDPEHPLQLDEQGVHSYYALAKKFWLHTVWHELPCKLKSLRQVLHVVGLKDVVQVRHGEKQSFAVIHILLLFRLNEMYPFSKSQVVQDTPEVQEVHPIIHRVHW